MYNNGRTPPPPRREDDFDPIASKGRGSGRGPSRGLGARYNPNLPLSKLLALDRPYLRPVNFVRAQLTPVLFERQEELIEVHEFKGAQSTLLIFPNHHGAHRHCQFSEPEDHIPTAEQVYRVFGHHEAAPPQDSFFQDPAAYLFEDADSEAVVTVDFGSLDKLLDGTPDSQPEPVPQAVVSSQQTTIDATVETKEDKSVFDAIMKALSVNTSEPNDPSSSAVGVAPVREQETEMNPGNEEPAATHRAVEVECRNEARPLFVLDAAPTFPSEPREEIVYTSGTKGSRPLGSQLPGDDEVIVYVAPHPRPGRAIPNILSKMDAPQAEGGPAVTLEPPASEAGTSRTASTSGYATALTRTPVSEPVEQFSGILSSSITVSQTPELDRQQMASPRACRLTKRSPQSRRRRRKERRRSSFGTFGAMLEERHLHEDEMVSYDKQGRREGSDIDWGDGNSDQASSGFGGMDVDGDLDLKAMESFAKSMSNKGQEHTTFDDIRDAEKLELEDGEDESPSGSEDSDSEARAVLKAEEEQFADEAGSTPTTDSEEGASSGDDKDPMEEFQNRLAKVRLDARAKGKMKETAFSAGRASPGSLFAARSSKLLERGKKREEDSEQGEDEDSDDFNENFTWAEQDDDYIADIQVSRLLDFPMQSANGTLEIGCFGRCR